MARSKWLDQRRQTERPPPHLWDAEELTDSSTLLVPQRCCFHVCVQKSLCVYESSAFAHFGRWAVEHSPLVHFSAGREVYTSFPWQRCSGLAVGARLPVIKQTVADASLIIIKQAARSSNAPRRSCGSSNIHWRNHLLWRFQDDHHSHILRCVSVEDGSHELYLIICAFD